MDDAGIVGIGFRQRAAYLGAHHVGIAQNGIERGLQVMAERGEEGRAVLQLAGRRFERHGSLFGLPLGGAYILHQ